MRLILFIILSQFIAGLFPLSAGVADYCPLPDSLPGWTFEFEPEVYTPDNLHDYIDGEAELYKKYEFVEMATATYVNKQNPALDFTADIYDMGTPLNAFGVYSIRRRQGMTFADIGEEATVSEMMVRFWKGKFYVQIVAGARDSSLSAVMQTMARRIAAMLPASPRPPELDMLPKEHQQFHTLTYRRDVRKDGIVFNRLLLAQYSTGKTDWIGFALLFDDAKEVRTWMNALGAPPSNLLLSIKNSVIFGVEKFKDVEMAKQFLRQATAQKKHGGSREK